MNGAQLQSDGMTPKELVPAWVCRHCKARKIINNVNEPKPPRCWNYKCRRMDWDRPPKKRGPRPGTKKARPRRTTKGRKGKGRG